MATIGPEELGQIFDHHAPALTLYARQWSTSPEDIVQEAFSALARQSSAPTRPAAWLFRVARNAALTAARRSKRRRTHETHAAHDGTPWFVTNDDSLDAQSAAALLTELPPDHREASVARIWGNVTFEEIAQLQGCSLTTAHRRYQTGLALLHERLRR